MNAEDFKDFQSRKGSPSPKVPNKPMPKFSENIPIHNPKDRQAWEAMDKSLEEWRKTFTGS